MMHQTTGSRDVVSRRWPVTIKYYWFGRGPAEGAMPDIAKLFSIPEPLSNGRNAESWTLLTDLSGTETELMSRLSKATRNQVRRAEREGITVEQLDCMDPQSLDRFFRFFSQFAETKGGERDLLNLSVQVRMLKRMAGASLLELSRALGPDGETLVYHMHIVAEGRARLHHSASLFREAQGTVQRQFLGWANRFLHWQDMLYYQKRKFKLYDMGGWYAGKDNESLLRINQFKEEFGGRPVREYDAMLGCTPMGRLALRFQDMLRKRLHGG